MKAAQIAHLLVVLFLLQPMWYFLLYTILCAIHPDRLVWFLYWAYVPTGYLATILVHVGFKDAQ